MLTSSKTKQCNLINKRYRFTNSIYKPRRCGLTHSFNIDKTAIRLECKPTGRRGYEEEKGRTVSK